MMFWTTLLLLMSPNKIESVYFNNPAIRETRAKVAVIDSGIKLNKETQKYLCYGKHYDLTNTGIEDTVDHGTNIAGIIAKQIDPAKTCILVIKYFAYRTNPFQYVGKAFEIALKENARFVNFSSGGQSIIHKERNNIQKLLKKKVYVSVAAGNNDHRLSDISCNYYPACYNFKSQYFHVVGNGKVGKPQKYSNYGEYVTDWRNGKEVEGFGITMSGSSQSTAILTGELAGKE